MNRTPDFRNALTVKPDSAAMARPLALMYVAAPTVAVVSLLLPYSSELDPTGVLVIAGVAYAVVPLLLRFPSVPPALFGVMIAFSNVLVTLVSWFGGETSTPYALYYAWATPLAFAFFSLRHAILQTLFAGALYAGLLAAMTTESGGEAGRWLLTMSTVAVAGLVVRAITQALRAEAELLERERRRRAVEINDNIVQGLVLAKGWSERGMLDESQGAVTEALANAQQIIVDLLGDEPLDEGALRRAEAARVARSSKREETH